MLELRLVGVHDDGENLVLESRDGTRFVLPIDANLRTSVTKARRVQPARGLGRKTNFGPRDIQTRFRQGATVEEIAEESGWEPERVRRYEWPIVAERAHIIRAAQGVKVGRRSSASGLAQIPITLSSRIAEVTEAYDFTHAAQDWTTRQKESGQWSIEVDFALTDGNHRVLPEKVVFPARWVYNPANQSLYASNEAAYFLMGNTLDEVYAPSQKVSQSDTDDEQTPTPQRENTKETKEANPKDSVPTVSTVPVVVTTGVSPVEEQAHPSSLQGSSPDERKLNELLELARRTTRAAVANQELHVVSQPQATAEEDVDIEHLLPEILDEDEQYEEEIIIFSRERNGRGITTYTRNVHGSDHPTHGADNQVHSVASEIIRNEAPEEVAKPVEAAPVEPAKPVDIAPAPLAPQPVEKAEPEPVEPVAESITEEVEATPATAQNTSEETAEKDRERESVVEKRPRTKASSRKQRMSVPAWDEIIFGGRK